MCCFILIVCMCVCVHIARREAIMSQLEGEAVVTCLISRNTGCKLISVILFLPVSFSRSRFSWVR